MAKKKTSTKKSVKTTEQLKKEAIAEIDTRTGDTPPEVPSEAPLENADNAPRSRPRKKGGTKATSGKERDTGHPRKKSGKRDGGSGGSGLDAAATVLADAKEPLGCKAIVERAMSKGLWHSGGKTPHATIYSAILREIQKKGREARFIKTERGRFAFNAKAAK